MYFFKIVYYELFFEHEYFEYLEYIFNRHFHFYIKIKASVFLLNSQGDRTLYLSFSRM